MKLLHSIIPFHFWLLVLQAVPSFGSSTKPLLFTSRVANAICTQLTGYKATGNLAQPISSRKSDSKPCFCFQKIPCEISGNLCMPFAYKKCKCPTASSANKGRVQNGTSVDTFKYPSFAYTSRGTEDEVLYSGGILIGDEWVLTSARLYAGESGAFTVWLGVLDRGNKDMEISKKVGIENIFYHYAYDKAGNDMVFNPRVYHDLALIKLGVKLVLDKPEVQPVTLPAYSLNIAYGSDQPKQGWVIGFGIGSSEGPGDKKILREVEVVIWEHNRCKNYWTTVSWRKNTWICAETVPATGPTPCWGDLGGPLYVKDSKDRLVLFGLYAFINGDSCKNPLMFTQVSDNLDWIRIVTGIRPNILQ